MVQASQFIDGDKKYNSFFQAHDFSRGLTITNYELSITNYFGGYNDVSPQ